MIAAGDRFAWFAADPLPDLLAGGLVGVDNKMLASGFGDLVVDLEAHGPVRNRRADVGDEAALLGHCRKVDGIAVDGDVELGLVLVPAQVLAEKRVEVERLQALPNGGDIEL